MELVVGENARICTQCKQLKHFDNFYKRKMGRYGIESSCKECIKIINAENYKKNIEKRRKYQREYHYKHREEQNKKRNKRYYENREYYLEYRKNYWETNKDQIKQWRKDNRDKLNEYQNKRKKEDVGYALRSTVSSRIRDALKDNHKSQKSRKLLGCTIKELKRHLEDQFTEGMSWDNYGYYGWHIDHIIPCASFDLSNKYAQAICFHYSNLQPLWAEDNYGKSDEIPDLGIKIDKEWIQNRGLR